MGREFPHYWFRHLMRLAVCYSCCLICFGVCRQYLDGQYREWGVRLHIELYIFPHLSQHLVREAMQINWDGARIHIINAR